MSSGTTDDILQELSVDKLNEMLRHLKTHLPGSIRGHHLLYNYLNNLEEINNRIKLDTLSHRWQPKFFGHHNGKIENCTYVAITPDKDYWINMCTVEKSGAELLECIAKTKRISWFARPMSISIDAEYFTEFNKIISPKRADWVYDKPEYIFQLSKQKVRDIPTPKIPDDLYLGSVPFELAPMINDTWDYKYNGSKEVIESSIRINGGTCLFRKSNNEAISWIITNDFFAPGFLRTIDSERRKGYGSMVSIMEMKRIVEKHSVDIFIFLVQGNLASESMHRKLGFEQVNECRWVVTN